MEEFIMTKINGYTKEEAQNFVQFMQQGLKRGRNLSQLFGDYSQKTGRARGSVRNYYYQLLKSTDNAEVRRILDGSGLHACRFVEFSDEEADTILREIVRQKSQGISVRRAVLNLAHGDDKLMLRYQNKYRNVLAKDPARLQALMDECGLSNADDQQRLEEEIDGLYDRLAQSLKDDNKRLADTIHRLTEENRLLRLRLRHLQG